MGLNGVDVANFQGLPEHWRVAAGNIQWAAVKISELQPPKPGWDGKYINEDASADWSYLKQQRKGRIAYLFGHPVMSVTATVDLFVTELRKLGIDDADGVALDLEVTDGKPSGHVATWAHQVLGLLQAQLHRRPLFYTFRDFAAEGNCAGLGEFPLWISDPSAAPRRPHIPAPWKSYAIHQYGITGAIDRDVANFASLAAMAAVIGKPAPKPPAHRPSNPTPTPASKPPVTKPPAAKPEVHYIEVPVAAWRAVNPPWNSTLAGIAAHEGTTVHELMRLNPQIKDASKIQAGTKIKVPIPS